MINIHIVTNTWINNLFFIDYSKLIDISISNNATIIYKFSINVSTDGLQDFIYYLNSGLGIDNQIYNVENYSIYNINKFIIY